MYCIYIYMSVHILFYMCFLDTISVHASNVASYVCDHFRTVCSRGSLRMKPARWLYLSRGFLCCSCLSTRTTSLFVASLQDHQTAHFPGSQQCGCGWTLHSYNLRRVPGMDRVGCASCSVRHSRLCTWNACCICSSDGRVPVGKPWVVSDG